MNYLGIDYGQQHIGLAWSAGNLAEPLETVAAGNIWQRLEILMAEYDIQAIVVGISEGSMAEETKTFITELKDRYHLPIFTQDETLSSQETRLKIARSGMKRKRREAKIDHLVAAHILQEFLDTQPKLEKH